MSQPFYLTTTLPYVNASPHIGFALEIVAADVLARYHALIGDEVIFNTGTDEHGQKIYQRAKDEGLRTKDYVDEYAKKFRDLQPLLNLFPDLRFIRTTDEHHIAAAQEFWRRVSTNGFIYKKNYQVKYCVGCELEKTESELADGKCPLHPTQELEQREEENYFFKFSEFQDKLLELYERQPEFVKPAGKFNEIKSFVAAGLQDLSISRIKAKMPWGIEVPGDSEHVMYVWFDALINYISTLNWPNDLTNFKRFWPGIQLCGKDNLRQQAAMWQAMLLAADLPPSKHILVNGFISVDGQKMSKSLGNVISPSEMVARYGVDGTRYLLMNLGPFGSDMDVSWEKLDTTYTADLSNGLGNLCSRVAKMCEKSEIKGQGERGKGQEFDGWYLEALGKFDISGALQRTSLLVNRADQYLSDAKPWKLEGEEQKKILLAAIAQLLEIVYHLQPFMPATAEKIIKHFSAEEITAMKPLFPRLVDRV